jgi:hypothetical protein
MIGGVNKWKGAHSLYIVLSVAIVVDGGDGAV